MKAFAIQLSADGYIGDTHLPLSLNSYYSLHTKTDIDDAKHWRTVKLTQKWLDTAITRTKTKLSELNTRKEYLDKQSRPNQWANSNVASSLRSAVNILSRLEGSTVIQIDHERPNFSNSTKPKYRGYSGCDMEIVTVNISKYTCSSCTVILKKIPFITIGSSNVCIPCMKLRQDKIDKAFEEMDEDIRTELTNNFIVSKI